MVKPLDVDHSKRCLGEVNYRLLNDLTITQSLSLSLSFNYGLASIVLLSSNNLYPQLKTARSNTRLVLKVRDKPINLYLVS